MARRGDATSDEELVRGLGFGQAASIVVGVVIGSGIFIGANRVAQGVDNVASLFAVWIGAGLLTLLGALTYAEFGALYPKSGGDYVYAQKSLGPFWGFFNGWIAFSINLPASVAALALAFAGQLNSLHEPLHRFLFHPEFALKFMAVAVIVLFTLINYLGVRQGGYAQQAVTVTKILLIFGLVGFGLFGSHVDPARLTEAAPATAGVATALVGALWAYDGWTNVTRVAGEVRDPQRNVPRSLALGVLGVILIYVLLTLAYLLVLGLDGMRGTGDEARLIATRAADELFGPTGRRIIGVVILVSILGPLNGLTLAGPRVYYAMARDRVFFQSLARVHPTRRVPHVSILFQGALSAVLALFFTFEQLSGFVVLASWVAYAITGIGLVLLRRRQPHLPRPYRVPLYPWIPLLFILLSSGFVLYLIYDAFQTTTATLYLLGNLGLMALAGPLYRVLVARRSGSPDPAPTNL